MSLPLLSLVTFVPLVGAALILAMPRPGAARWIALGTTIITFALSLMVWIQFDPHNPGFQLVELNAKTGAMIGSFGTSGVLDLKVGAVFGKGQPIDLETGEIGVHSTPAVIKDVVIIGSAMREGATVPTHNNTKGLVRAFDVRTGKLLWTFNTIPRPGDFGNDTWEKESWAVNGNTGVWTQITADEELGLVYLPVETPSSDFYGGHRPGNNLFAESLVCVDLKTGVRKWHYQFVHHPIWNFDNSSAPLLLDITVNGKAIKPVASPSKLG